MGDTRIKLAALLEQTVGGLKVNPEDLRLENPRHMALDFACCTWYAKAECYGDPVHILGYGAMKDCVRLGVTVEKLDPEIVFEVKGGQKAKVRKRG